MSIVDAVAIDVVGPISSVSIITVAGTGKICIHTRGSEKGPSAYYKVVLLKCITFKSL